VFEILKIVVNFIQITYTLYVDLIEILNFLSGQRTKYKLFI